MLTFVGIFRDVCLPIILLVGVGWGMDRKFDLKLDTLVKLNIYLFVPAFIFVRVSSSELPQGMGGKIVAFTLCVVAAMYLASSLVSMLRGETAQQRMGLQLSTMFYNSGNWGIPLMALAFPEAGPVIQVFVLMTMNISTFSIGILLASAQGALESQGKPWKHFLPMLRQPSIYAILAALMMRSMGNPLDEVAFIWKPLEYLASSLVAFALITLGVQLSKTRPPRIEGRLAWALGIRLAGGPLAAFLLARLFAFDAATTAVLIVGAASPTAVNTALLAPEFKADSRFAAAMVFYSTLLAGIVVTALIFLLR